MMIRKINLLMEPKIRINLKKLHFLFKKQTVVTSVTNCILSPDVCNPSYCENGATCVVDGNDYACECSEGYFGRNCSIGKKRICSG